MSVFSLQLQNNILPVPASNENKLKYGEVITPLDFAEKITQKIRKIIDSSIPYELNKNSIKKRIRIRNNIPPKYLIFVIF